jgi:hypothetical protein
MLKESTSIQIIPQTFVNMIAVLFVVRNRSTLFLNFDQQYSWIQLLVHPQNLEL